MNVEAEPIVSKRWPDSVRWGLCFLLALSFHAAGAAALFARLSESSDLVANAPVIMIDLAPVPVAPEITPTEVPPDVVQSAEAEPEPEPEKPIEKVELKPDPVPEPELAMVPPPPVEKPKEEKKKAKKRSEAREASRAENRASFAAAPLPGASSRDSNAVPNWKSQLVARLERNKRYPSEARGESGVAQVAFSVDRNGGVHGVRLVRSSGSSSLDRETLALVERAQPLPAPPPEMPGSQIAISVPIRYSQR